MKKSVLVSALAVVLILPSILLSCGNINDSAVEYTEDVDTGISNAETSAINDNNIISAEYDRKAIVLDACDDEEDLSYDSAVFVTAEFDTGYQSFESLIHNAEIAVEGLVIENYTFKCKLSYGFDPCNISKIQVTKVYSGDVKEGDIVIIVEYGGVITAEEAGLTRKFPDMTEEEKNKKLYFSYGIDLTRKGDLLLVFASKDENQLLDLGEPYYYPLCDYQGKLKYNPDDNSFSRQLPEGQESWYGDLKTNANDMEKTLEVAKKADPVYTEPSSNHNSVVYEESSNSESLD